MEKENKIKICVHNWQLVLFNVISRDLPLIIYEMLHRHPIQHQALLQFLVLT